MSALEPRPEVHLVRNPEQWAIEIRAGGERLRHPQHLFLLIRTWNAFRAGEKLHILRLSSGGTTADGVTRSIPSAIPEPK